MLFWQMNELMQELTHKNQWELVINHWLYLLTRFGLSCLESNPPFIYYINVFFYQEDI